MSREPSLLLTSSGSKKRISNSFFRTLLWCIILSLVVAQVYISTFLRWVPHQDSDSTTSIHVENMQQSVPTPTRVSKGNKWAYAFLVAGCDPEKPLGYRNYFYNILVASKLLTTNVENADHSIDILVMIQFKKSSNATRLPERDLQWLKTNKQLRIHYLPAPIRDNFYNSQFEKFRILEFTDYSRILYLDADVMPLCSLDYLFDLSERNVLKENVVLAWFKEPASGGFFLLEPGKGYYQDLLQIIEKREENLGGEETSGADYWDPLMGWGVQLTEEWRGIPSMPTSGIRHSKNWSFHGDFADQGLLYYWARFYKQNVTIIFLDEVENWQDGRLVHTYKSSSLFEQKSCLPKGEERAGHYGSTLNQPTFYGKVPHRDFIHFTGDKKPWEQKTRTFPSLKEVHSSRDYWYYNLGLIIEQVAKKYPNRKLPSLPLKWNTPSLGRYPTLRSMIGTIKKKKKKKAADQAKAEFVE